MYDRSAGSAGNTGNTGSAGGCAGLASTPTQFSTIVSLYCDLCPLMLYSQKSEARFHKRKFEAKLCKKFQAHNNSRKIPPSAILLMLITERGSTSLNVRVAWPSSSSSPDITETLQKNKLEL